MISTAFPAIVLKSGSDRVAIPVEVTFTYDADYDPFAVQMLVEAPGEPDVVWYFSRELLLRGVNSYIAVGSGDVKFRYDGSDRLLMCLRNPNGHADLGLPHSRVATFLQETLELTSASVECPVEMIDNLIEEILNG